MTREEVIEYWEGLRKTFSSQFEREENYFGRMHLQTTIDVIDTTISALRAQQEQERNDPLTLDELRKMDGEPSWFVSLHDGFASWGIVRVVEMSKAWFIAVAGAERAFGDLDGYGKTWLAYRQKPEGQR